jgi:hypothetical protein
MSLEIVPEQFSLYPSSGNFKHSFSDFLPDQMSPWKTPWLTLPAHDASKGPSGHGSTNHPCCQKEKKRQEFRRFSMVNAAA